MGEEAINNEFECRDTCFFLGSGSSKALMDLPIQNKFIEDFLLWDSKQDMKMISHELRSQLSAVQDIELIVSHYHNLAYQDKGGRKSEYVRELMYLRVALSLYINDRESENHDNNRSLSSNLISHYLNENGLSSKNLVFITTNYDLVIEHLLEDIFGKSSYWYPGIQKRKVGAIPILKLHGSINWLENRGSSSASGFTRVNSEDLLILKPSDIRLKKSPWDDIGCFLEENEAKYTPMIVPFLFQKSAWLREDNQVWKKRFDDIWSIAEQYMRKANQLEFWGYGLPSADYHMFSFLYQILDNPKKRYKKVSVIEKGNAQTNLLKLVKLLIDNPFLYQGGLGKYLRNNCAKDLWDYCMLPFNMLQSN